MQKNNLIAHSFYYYSELLQSRELWNLIGQEKVGHLWPEPSRKTKPICWL